MKANDPLPELGDSLTIPWGSLAEYLPKYLNMSSRLKLVDLEGSLWVSLRDSNELLYNLREEGGE